MEADRWLTGKKCRYCKNIAVYYRKHSGEYLCKKHFIKSIERKVMRAIGGRVRRGMKIGLAVSGGKDSLTMAYIIWKLSRPHTNSKLIGLIVDEGIDGYRDRSIKYAVGLMKKLNIEYYIMSFKESFNFSIDLLVNEGHIDNPCTFCGVFRRRILEILGRELGVDRILTGHNANDIAETVILNIIQGNLKHILYDLDVGGELIPHITPLKYILEYEVVLYAYFNNIEYYEGPCPYVTYALRSEVRTFINNIEWNHPGIIYNILRFSEKIKSGEKLKTFRCEICGFPTTRKICKVCELKRVLSTRS